MNQRRNNGFFYFGLLAAALLSLAALSYRYVTDRSTATNTNADPKAVPGTDETPGERELDHQPVNHTDQSVTLAAASFLDEQQLPQGYVGTAVCASCHSDRHESYLQTHHSRSLRGVSDATDLGEQTLTHRASQHSYDVYQQDGQPRHRQWRHFSSNPGDRIPAGDHPVAFVMGSGSFGKGYLLADGEYLLQSPVTWYAGSDQLGMAPGYDRRHHVGFGRVIQAECMFCHAGLLSKRDQNPDHLILHELSIGCERCHGPGAEHTRLYRELEAGSVAATVATEDPKIVHPAKLDRHLTESICGQCHLHGDAVVQQPGREIWDFVAGEDLAATRLHYKQDQPGQFSDSFTGHFDQLWQSKCYLQSDTLTCITCHNPHQSEPVTDRVSWRRQQCNDCHSGAATDTCNLELNDRIAKNENDCTACHMPKIESEVPHTSTTSHWIAVYESGKPRQAQSEDTTHLRRIQTNPRLPERLLDRADAIAAASLAVQQAREGDFSALDTQGLDEQVRQVLALDADDAVANSLLARMNRLRADRVEAGLSATEQVDVDQLWRGVARYADAALNSEARPVEARKWALESLANQQMRDGDYAAAISTLGELTRIRRLAVDWYNLGLCFGKQRRFAEAESALREAIRIDGTYAAAYRSLAILYRSINPTAARQYAAIAERLR